MRTQTTTEETSTEPSVDAVEATTTDVRTMGELRAGAGCRRCPNVLDETRIIVDGETRKVECPNCGFIDEVVGR